MASKYDRVLEQLPLTRKDSGDVRKDAAIVLGSEFLALQLEALEQQPYEVLKTPNQYRQAMAINTNFPAGCDTVGIKVIDYVGQAKFIANSGDDIPLVKLQMGKGTQRVGTIGQGYQVHLPELQAAQMSGLQLEAEEARAAGRFIENLQDKAAAIGEPSLSTTGLLNNPDVRVNTVSGGLGFQAKIDAGNAQKVLEDLNGAMSDMVKFSKGQIRPNRCVMGFDVYRILDSSLFGTTGYYTGQSLLTAWFNSNPYIKSTDAIILWDYAETASSTGSSRVVFYNNDPQFIDVAIPMEMNSVPPQNDGLAISVFMWSRFSGTRVKQPMAVVYLDGAIA
jgi:hypothetical protein